MDVLFETKKRKAEDSGICGDMVATPAMSTVFAYDHFARVMDAQVSTVNRDSARAKSVNREIASRSMCTFATHVASTIVTSMIPDKWHNATIIDEGLVVISVGIIALETLVLLMIHW